MSALIECVPNFSEGRDLEVIRQITARIESVEGATLLHVDPGKATNRTVVTFAGPPEPVVEAAFRAIAAAAQLIDMRQHSGAHPRMGATDVCPLVPISGISMEETAGHARRLAERVGRELGIPVYLYEAAQPNPARRNLATIRAGEYEGLADRIRLPEWTPDFGPAEFLPAWGATATGARFFLIAYNVNVLGTKEQAHRIALDVREQGRGPDQPGRLRAVKAIGWWVAEYGMAQVSMNLDDYTTTPLHAAFEACAERARALRVAVAGSEIVGLVPLQALLRSADHYIDREGLLIVDERQKIRLVADRLGLSAASPFVPEQRIIEYRMGREPEPLAGLTLRGFVELTGSRAPAPGGGSASALMAALGAALGAMVGWMTYGKRRFEDQDAAMRRLIPILHGAMDELIPLVDADTRAFDAYRAAAALSADTPERAAARDAAVQAAVRRAVEVPLLTMRTADRCWDALVEMARHGNPASRSDLEVGAKALEAGIWGAGRNVAINLSELADADARRRAEAEARALGERAALRRDEVLAAVAARAAGV